MDFNNETTVERIMAYVEREQYEQAEALAPRASRRVFSTLPASTP